MTRRYLATTFSIALVGALAIAACSTDDGGGATVCTEATLCRFCARRWHPAHGDGDSEGA